MFTVTSPTFFMPMTNSSLCKVSKHRDRSSTAYRSLIHRNPNSCTQLIGIVARIFVYSKGSVWHRFDSVVAFAKRPKAQLRPRKGIRSPLRPGEPVEQIKSDWLYTGKPSVEQKRRARRGLLVSVAYERSDESRSDEVGQHRRLLPVGVPSRSSYVRDDEGTELL